MIVVTSAAAPSTSERFAMFEPMMLPTAMSSWPWPAARPDTTISGAEVPKPITTAPMTTGDSRSDAATRTAPTTNQSAAAVRTARPTTIPSTASSMAAETTTRPEVASAATHPTATPRDLP